MTSHTHSTKDDATPEDNRFVHKKSLGQNFLTSDYVPTLMCDAGMVNPEDTILEIGPGTGALTKELLRRRARVIAIETDPRALTILQDTFAREIAEQQLTLIEADIRNYELETLINTLPTYKIVANIPYYLSGYLLRTALELPKPPQSIVFLMQKEVVHRICRDKKSSLLGLSVRVYGEPIYVKTISRGHFNPPPQVDSAILLVKNISHEHLPDKDTQAQFFTLLHRGLGSKRKQLRGLLREHYSDEILKTIFSQLEIEETVRGEDLPLKTWLALYRALPSTQ